MRPHRFDEELTFPEAARALKRRKDSRGRRLRQIVLAKERASGKQIALRIGGRGRAQLRVTLGAIYRFFPEMRRDRVDALLEVVQPIVDRARASTRLLVQEVIAESVEPRIARLEKRTALTEKYIADLHRLDAPRKTTKSQK